MTPVSKTSTSMVAFSVSTTAMMSPRFTTSPGLTSHSMMVPASMSAPSAGMQNSATSAHHGRHGFDDCRYPWNSSLFQVFRVRHRRFGTAYAGDRHVKFVKGAFHDARANLGGDTAAAPPLIDDNCPMSPRDRFEDRLAIKRAQRPEVDDFRVDADASQFL